MKTSTITARTFNSLYTPTEIKKILDIERRYRTDESFEWRETKGYHPLFYIPKRRDKPVSDTEIIFIIEMYERACNLFNTMIDQLPANNKGIQCNLIERAVCYPSVRNGKPIGLDYPGGLMITIYSETTSTDHTFFGESLFNFIQYAKHFEWTDTLENEYFESYPEYCEQTIETDGLVFQIERKDESK